MNGRLPFSQRPYRRGVGILLLNSGGKVFVARRVDVDALDLDLGDEFLEICYHDVQGAVDRPP